jgi:hypothetical protein
MIQPNPAPINPRELMYASIVSLIPFVPSADADSVSRVYLMSAGP